MSQTCRLPTAAVIAAAVLLAVSPRPALSQAVELVVVDVTTVAKGYRTSKLLDSDVVNDGKERIGKVDDIIIGRNLALFAVLQVGGFLDLGSHLVAVPFQNLVLDGPGGKIVLPGATKDELKKLPQFKYRE